MATEREGRRGRNNGGGGSWKSGAVLGICLSGKKEQGGEPKARQGKKKKSNNPKLKSVEHGAACIE